MSSASARGPRRAGWIVFAFLGNLAGMAWGDIFTVTTAADSGAGTLRWAIQSSNATAGPNEIRFSIPAAVPVTISPVTALPIVTTPTAIDATGQPGFVGAPVVVLDGTGAGVGASGLFIRAGGSLVRGLVIRRFASAGVRLEGGSGNVVEGNYIGTDATGLVGQGNSGDGILVGEGCSQNRLGGIFPAARNVIANNKESGIALNSGIGQNAILGNYIGVNATATAALGNSLAGILVRNGDNLVGGPTAASRNIVSGNGWSGIYVYETGAVNNVIKGNFVGTDGTGQVALGNRDRGIAILNANNNQIGSPGAGNLISGNIASGLLIDGFTTGTVVQGNYLGCDVTGLLPLGNGIDGLEIRAAHDNLVGGAGAGAGNLVSANAESGISIFDALAVGNVIQGNWVGTQANGVGTLGNRQYGITVFYSAHHNLIGGTGAGEGNVVAHNCALNVNYDGVRIHDTAGVSNRVSGNSIFDNNGALDLDVGPNGATANNPANTNSFPNFPVLTCAAVRAGRATIYGTLSGPAGQTFSVELFSSISTPSSSSGAAQRFANFTAVTTDAFGVARFALVCPAASLAGPLLSATATSAAQTTSELCPAVAASALDTDFDGLPDVFETAFQLDPGDPTDASRDAEGDGASNLQEFLAATNPRTSSGILRISAVEFNPPAVTFSSVAGLHYRLETTSSLLLPWLPAVNNIPGTGGIVRVPDPTWAGAGRAFYRISTLP